MNLRLSYTLCLSFFFITIVSGAQTEKLTVSGKIYQRDSINTIPFAYILNKKNSTGTVADIEARFSIPAEITDTLIISYLGFHPVYLPLAHYRDSVKDGRLSITIYLRTKEIELQPAVIRYTGFTENERRYYNRVLFRPRADISSPVSLLYEKFSRRGRSLRKLDSLYMQLLREEAIEERLNNAMLRHLTGNENITLQLLRRRCYIPDYFILTAKEYDLYETVHNCYKQHFK